MRKPSGQTFITIGALALAGCAIVLASVYSGGQSNGPVINVGAAGDGPDGAGLTPVEGFFPRTGQGGACSEQVGVDLIDGYGATLVINGVPIPESEMNTFIAPEVREGEEENETRSSVVSAAGSLGRFTWGPEEGCPNGTILQPRGNIVVACVYELDDNPANCLPYRYTFDVL